MHSKVIFPMLLAIAVIGISQSAFAEEEMETYIAIDIEEFAQPDSSNNYQEITIIGHVQEYMRGDNITLTIIYPDESEKELNTYATKKGDIYTLIHITQDSQIGTHMIFLDYGMDLAYTSFEILESE